MLCLIMLLDDHNTSSSSHHHSLPDYHALPYDYTTWMPTVASDVAALPNYPKFAYATKLYTASCI